MFATFGEIVFELLGSPDSFKSVRRWHYAEHRVIEDAARLQWVGDGLETITIAMLFHASYMDPAAQSAALLAAAADHGARALVFGNGDHRGYFVVTSMRTIYRHTAADGSPIAIAVQAELKESPLADAVNSGALLRPPFTPIGLAPAVAGVPTGPIPYSAPSGIASTPAAPAVVYNPPALAGPGVSPILNNPPAAGAAPLNILPLDIPAATIVRSGR
jgi:phage protein U